MVRGWLGLCVFSSSGGGEATGQWQKQGRLSTGQKLERDPMQTRYRETDQGNRMLLGQKLLPEDS